jgi:hypothetical protein
MIMKFGLAACVITADTKSAAIAHTRIYDFRFMLDVEQRIKSQLLGVCLEPVNGM